MTVEDDGMIPVLDRKSSQRFKAFGMGFVDGIGVVGSLAVPSRSNSVSRRRVLLKVGQRSWRTDKIMIHRDFQVAIGKLNGRTEEE